MEKLVNLWLESPNVNEDDKVLIKGLSDVDLEDAFYKDVEFGTAGMRGLMGVGTNRLNTHTIKRATLAYAQFINGRKFNKRVAIAYDNRNNSRLFAEVAAAVLAKENIEVLIFDEVMATPLLSYAVRELNCGGGIVITASHNPKEYNGFKVYDERGCQLITELAEIVIENVAKIENYLDIDTNLNAEEESLIKTIDDELLESYLEVVLSKQLNENTNDDFSAVFSPQHGAGINVIPQLLERANYKHYIVKSQATLDGNFSNTESPNPEDSGAYTEGIKLAKEKNANVVVTSDPDADRVGIAVLHDGEYKLLNGNETASVILYYLLTEKERQGKLVDDGIIINTIVTSDIGEVIAKDFGVKTLKTLTGFKYIGTLMDEADNLDKYVYAYEESYGSLPIPIIRDKDAASATLLLCEIAAFYDKMDLTLIDVLDKMYEKYGYYQDSQSSVEVAGIEGPTKIVEIMDKFNSETVGKYDDYEITMIENYNTSDRVGVDFTEKLDYEKSNAIKIFFKDLGWIAIRPSGTEPKIKFYYGAKGNSKANVEKNHSKLVAYVEEKIR